MQISYVIHGGPKETSTMEKGYVNHRGLQLTSMMKNGGPKLTTTIEKCKLTHRGPN